MPTIDIFNWKQHCCHDGFPTQACICPRDCGCRIWGPCKNIGVRSRPTGVQKQKALPYLISLYENMREHLEQVEEFHRKLECASDVCDFSELARDYPSALRRGECKCLRHLTPDERRAVRRAFKAFGL